MACVPEKCVQFVQIIQIEQFEKYEGVCSPLLRRSKSLIFLARILKENAAAAASIDLWEKMLTQRRRQPILNFSRFGRSWKPQDGRSHGGSFK